MIKKAISYCGLCGAEKSSGNTVQRTQLSKQRNKHLQTTLIEAAKMAPRNNPELAMLYDQEKQKGNANRATLAVARKLVAYLMAVDRGQRKFQVVETNCIAAYSGAGDKEEFFRARQESFCPLDKDLSWKSAYRTSGFEIKHVDYFRVALDSGTTIK